MAATVHHCNYITHS